MISWAAKTYAEEVRWYVEPDAYFMRFRRAFSFRLTDCLTVDRIGGSGLGEKTVLRMSRISRLLSPTTTEMTMAGLD
jgi:hypothetical protein